jgi:TfoX/Sxy family transcriptional regulator of competence genes
MSSRQETVDFILEQIAGAGAVSARKMFGEYAIYMGPKVVALVCDDQLFVKPTKDGRSFIGVPEEAPAYPGAKNSFLIAGELWDDSEWLSTLIAKTAAELPLPKLKKPKLKTKVK